ncbi:MAG: hypothetical protein MHM6MM_006644 [Cercozoa sp. M6MM]
MSHKPVGFWGWFLRRRAWRKDTWRRVWFVLLPDELVFFAAPEDATRLACTPSADADQDSDDDEVRVLGRVLLRSVVAVVRDMQCPDIGLPVQLQKFDPVGLLLVTTRHALRVRLLKSDGMVHWPALTQRTVARAVPTDLCDACGLDTHGQLARVGAPSEGIRDQGRPKEALLSVWLRHRTLTFLWQPATLVFAWPHLLVFKSRRIALNFLDWRLAPCDTSEDWLESFHDNLVFGMPLDAVSPPCPVAVVDYPNASGPTVASGQKLAYSITLDDSFGDDIVIGVSQANARGSATDAETDGVATSSGSSASSRHSSDGETEARCRVDWLTLFSVLELRYVQAVNRAQLASATRRGRGRGRSVLLSNSRETDESDHQQQQQQQQQSPQQEREATQQNTEKTEKTEDDMVIESLDRWLGITTADSPTTADSTDRSSGAGCYGDNYVSGSDDTSVKSHVSCDRDKDDSNSSGSNADSDADSVEAASPVSTPIKRTSVQCKARVRARILPRHRRVLWPLCLGVFNLSGDESSLDDESTTESTQRLRWQRRARAHADTYAALIRRTLRYDNAVATAANEDVSTVVKDIPRTRPRCRFLDEAISETRLEEVRRAIQKSDDDDTGRWEFCNLHNATHRAALERILVVFAKTAGALGYVQGMSDMAAVFYYALLHQTDEGTDEDDSCDEALVFFCFLRFASRLSDLFAHELDDTSAGVLGVASAFEELLRQHLPDIAARLDALHVQPSTVVLPWVLTMFSQILPLPMLCRLWDRLLLPTSDTPDEKRMFQLKRTSFASPLVARVFAASLALLEVLKSPLLARGCGLEQVMSLCQAPPLHDDSIADTFLASVDKWLVVLGCDVPLDEENADGKGPTWRLPRWTRKKKRN